MRNHGVLQDLDFSDFGEGLKKWGFALDWMLSGIRSNSIIEYLNKSYLKRGKIKAKIKM